jgi:hypothetical protein
MKESCSSAEQDLHSDSRCHTATTDRASSSRRGRRHSVCRRFALKEGTARPLGGYSHTMCGWTGSTPAWSTWTAPAGCSRRSTAAPRRRCRLAGTAGPEWRAAITHVWIDISATYARAARIALPHAIVVVDRFDLVQLANRALTEYRRELTWANRGRRGRKVDPEWAHRNRLLRDAETLTADERARLHDALRRADPSGGLEKRRQAKELLGDLLGPRTHRWTGSEPDLAATDGLLHALRRLRDRPTPPAGPDRERLATLRHRRPDHRHQQRPHRGLQQVHQTRRQEIG